MLTITMISGKVNWHWFQHCILALKADYEKMEERLPKAEDLVGAAKGLMRLQDVYALSIKGLIKGEFLQSIGEDVSSIYRPTVSSTLSADDCFQIGKVRKTMAGKLFYSFVWENGTCITCIQIAFVYFFGIAFCDINLLSSRSCLRSISGKVFKCVTILHAGIN